MNIIEKIDNLTVLDYTNPETISNAMQEAKQEIERLQEELKSARILPEALKKEIDRLDSAYLLAVKGRKNFREAFRKSKSELKEAQMETLTLLSENERLRSDRVELVRYCLKKYNPLHYVVTDGEAKEIITQFEKERQ